MAWTAWFDDVTSSAHGAVGGKAAQLGELARAGLPIPPGFVVTAEALREFFAAEPLAARLSRLCGADDAVLDKLGSELVDLVNKSAFPARIASAICNASRALGDEPLLAVRTSPDPDAFDPHALGMMASVLDVRSEDALIAAVRTCWAALFAPPVLHRQKRAGLLDRAAQLRVGVIVQKMIDADKSGLAFSVEPTSGNPDVVEVESTFGESAPLLDGSIEPDRYLLDKTNLRLVSRAIGDKRVELVHDADHARGRLRRADPKRAHAPSLDDAEVRAAAELACRSEQYFGEPRGVEFAIAGDLLFAIETRPVSGYRMARHV